MSKKKDPKDDDVAGIKATDEPAEEEVVDEEAVADISDAALEDVLPPSDDFIMPGDPEVEEFEVEDEEETDEEEGEDSENWV